jgi:protein SCO1
MRTIEGGMSALKIIRWISWALVAVAIFVVSGVAVGWFRTEWLGQGQVTTVSTVGKPDIGGPFSLLNHRGERVTQDSFKGKPTAYFFGFTHCPEVCPTTLFEMTRRLQELGPDADRLNVVFVTVDPERDTPELLKSYLESFDARIVGLTGTPDEVAAMTKAFRIAVQKVPVEGGGYMVNHTASIVVTDASGEFVTLIDYHEDAEAASAKLRRALG